MVMLHDGHPDVADVLRNRGAGIDSAATVFAVPAMHAPVHTSSVAEMIYYPSVRRASRSCRTARIALQISSFPPLCGCFPRVKPGGFFGKLCGLVPDNSGVSAGHLSKRLAICNVSRVISARVFSRATRVVAWVFFYRYPPGRLTLNPAFRQQHRVAFPGVPTLKHIFPVAGQQCPAFLLERS